MDQLSMPWVIVPLWATSLVYLVSGALISSYLGSFWDRIAKPVVLTMFMGSIFWAVFALLLMSHNGLTARIWSRFFLPAAYLTEVSVIQAQVALLHLRKWRYDSLLWIMGIVFAIFLNFPGCAWNPILKPIPDGFWIAIVHPSWAIIAVKALIYGGGATAIVGLSIYSLWKRSRKQSVIYMLAGLLTTALFVHDIWWIQHHRTYYPTIWIGGLFLWAILWFELRQQVKRTHQQLTVDELTGAMTRSFGHLYATSLLQSTSLGLVFCDLDQFKLVNDQFGHAAGDNILRQTVDRLKSVCRPEDQIIRLGGDEFVMIFPSTDLNDGPQILPRIQEAIETHPFTISPGHVVNLGISLGWSWEPMGGHFNEAVMRSDHAMYQQKELHHQCSTTPS
ncbi:GGDEF domain-containing protein [Sulfobacillus thermosulfidooxidans]|uniref:GGDEF domain-containing protein n=1 Tax=Sulfobacillus thermosulfidooxidans TaxID=28034 RepID=UPI000422391F|nr:GGDEF domain-containing protein [Sulfobacillus thermosulfidooxidans]